MNIRLLLAIALFSLYGPEVRSHEHDKRQVAAAPAGPTESPADMLMRLKLMTYEEKLKAKAAKKQAKADKKAQKDAAFTAYMTAIAQGAMAPVAAGGAAPPAPAPAPIQTVVPPMPMLPAMGLWKKSFLLSQIMAAAAAQNAQIAAASAALATTTTTTPAPVPAPTSAAVTTTPPIIAEPESDDDSDESEEDKTINEIVKRYAPILRRKFYGPRHEDEDSEEFEENEDDEIPEDENEEDPSYQSGSFNKLGTGSPNGIGYEDAKVNQAGCSGSHIHICSGTTVYLTNPDEVTNQNPLLQDEESKPEEIQEQEVTHPKFTPKRGHGHRH